MKHQLIILSIVFSSSFIIAQETIAVVDFDAKGVSDTVASALTDRFASELFNLGIFRLIERERVGEVLNEQGFQQSGCTTAECAVELGQMLGTEKIITGSISKVGNVFSVSSRIINVESGEIYKMSTYDYQGNIGQLLMTGMSIAVNKLVETTLTQFPESQNPVKAVASSAPSIPLPKTTLKFSASNRSTYQTPDEKIREKEEKERMAKAAKKDLIFWLEVQD